MLTALGLALAASSALAAPGDPVAGAKAWAGLVDRGQYAQSWSEAGSLFRSQISSAAWARMAAGVRGPLGPVVSRTLSSVRRSTSMPGAPDGRYARVQFSTAFARKRQAAETVVLADGPTGWRVDGYFIR
jgi:hypothetical protein